MRVPPPSGRARELLAQTRGSDNRSRYGASMRLNSRAALTCPEFLHKTYAPTCFDLTAAIELSPVAQAMSEQGLIHEQRVVSKLKIANPDHCIIESGLPPEAREIATVKAMLDPGVHIIISPVLGETTERMIAETLGQTWNALQQRSSRPDLLVRVNAEPSPLGTWAAVDIKSHGAFDKKNKSNDVILTPTTFVPDPALGTTAGRLKDEDAMQLAHYHRHLESMGIANNETWAGIIGRDMETIAWARLDQTTFGAGRNALDALSKYDVGFASAMDVATSAQTRNSNHQLPAPAIPMYDSSAKMCPTCTFQKICLEEMTNYKGSGNVTLLATVTPNKATTNLPTGISIGELATTNEPLNSFSDIARQRAHVYLTRTPELRLDVTDFVIPTFDVEIDIDLENSQGVLQELGFDESVEPDRLYLYGYITHDGTVHDDWNKSEYGTFEDYSGTQEGEHSVYLRMWEYLQDRIALANSQGKTIGIFHYSQHEVTWWKKWITNFSDLPGTPSQDELDNFLAGYMHDLYPMAQKVVFPANDKSPVCSYSIKSIAPLSGFSWYADDAGGANSLLKYKEATGTDALVADAAREWLRNYNVDDVRATMALRNWLRTLNLETN